MTGNYIDATLKRMRSGYRIVCEGEWYILYRGDVAECSSRNPEIIVAEYHAAIARHRNGGAHARG